MELLSLYNDFYLLFFPFLLFYYYFCLRDCNDNIDFYFGHRHPKKYIIVYSASLELYEDKISFIFLSIFLQLQLPHWLLFDHRHTDILPFVVTGNGQDTTLICPWLRKSTSWAISAWASLHQQTVLLTSVDTSETSRMRPPAVIREKKGI